MVKRAPDVEADGQPRRSKRAMPDPSEGVEVKAVEGELLLQIDHLNESDKEAMTWIILHLTDPSNQQEIKRCKRVLESGLCSSDRTLEEIQKYQYFNLNWTTWGMLPKHYIAQTLVNLCGFKKETIRLIESTKGHALRNIFVFVFGLSDEVYWPPSLHRHELLAEFLRGQLDRNGARHTKVLNSLNSDGRVDWGKAMAFTIIWKEDPENKKRRIVDSIEHSSGVTAKLTMFTLHEDLKVRDAWDDQTAHFIVHHTIRPRLADFFPEDCWFREIGSAKYISKEAERLREEWSKRIADSKAVMNDILQNPGAPEPASSSSKVVEPRDYCPSDVRPYVAPKSMPKKSKQ